MPESKKKRSTAGGPPARGEAKPKAGKARRPQRRAGLKNLLIMGGVATTILIMGFALIQFAFGPSVQELSQYEGLLPKWVLTSPFQIREAYAFAVERPDVLQYMPCYCGCGQHSGHTSNLSCFIKGKTGQGYEFDNHGST